ncbi:hypothetical protein LSTR_LSTR004440 [Laodelphax striatellus]|uniref:Uncharacterized protein n=1 Tax=Laodelphax striatellus TaxID=195883 RepID=A0A482XB53_LAOST|nr:hypothetical protein LSTR_LSTR004440 [Laodelphax striatellus]
MRLCGEILRTQSIHAIREGVEGVLYFNRCGHSGKHTQRKSIGILVAQETNRRAANPDEVLPIAKCLTFLCPVLDGRRPVILASNIRCLYTGPPRDGGTS